MQAVCGTRCARAKVNADKRAAKASERASDRKSREAQKTLPQLKAECKAWMHLWVRLRDKDKGCISCGEPLQGPAIGGAFDAGHYRSVGSAHHLQFDPLNVHGQCKYCNCQLSGDPVRYRIGLIARIGLQAVEELDYDETPRKYTRQQVRDLREHYKALAKAEQSKIKDA
jgi:Bacteriophage Lambda NinG protein